MYSIISTLDEDADGQIKQLRFWLTKRHQALGTTINLEPHLSWLSAEKLNLTRVGEILTHYAHSVAPIHLATTGFGIFSGKTPVIYLPVIKTTECSQIHGRLWELLDSELSGEVPLFRPEQWHPHITLFYIDANTIEFLGSILAELAIMDFQLHFTINQFKLGYYKDGIYGLQSEHYFKSPQL